jgi:methionine sulfoxide reductase heme-binding subunit
MQSKSRSKTPYRWLKPAVFVGSLTPVAVLLLRAVRDELGANPISQALNQLGLIALIFLVAALTCTPLKTLFGWTWPLRLRRMLGLFGFAYATLHVSTYVGIDQFFDWQAITADILKRPFIFVGFAAFVLLIPLAVTSTATWIKRLGYARWKQLHRLAYIAPFLGVLHFTWRVKKDVSEPLTYASILGVLLLIRVAAALYERRTVMLAGVKSR